MKKKMKSFQANFYYQFIASCRSWQSVFFTIMFTPILFIIFGYAFNINKEYAQFFLPGMIASTVCSDALHAVGPVIKNYYTMNIVRYFKNYPPNISKLFIAFIITRLLFVLMGSIILVIIAMLFFNFTPSFFTILRYLIGIFITFWTYSFIALTFSFYGLKDNRDQGMIGIYYFLNIFLSDTFFILSKINIFFEVISYLFPLKYILVYMRGENDIYLIYSTLIGIISFLIFKVLINKIKIIRL